MGKQYRIDIVEGATFLCDEDERVLIAMERCGVEDIGVGCRGGGCGICRVRVAKGAYRLGKMSANKVCEEERLAGYALACRLFPQDDLLIEIETH